MTDATPTTATQEATDPATALVTMYDSASPWDIPVGAPAVAGYGDGIYVWKVSSWARFPGVPHKVIAVKSSDDGDVLDVENGDATPADAPGWLTRQRARLAPGEPDRFAVYCSESVRQAVTDACQVAGVALPWEWVAIRTNVATMADGPRVVATQWTDDNNRYDVSEAMAWWLGLTDPPATTPPADSSTGAGGAPPVPAAPSPAPATPPATPEVSVDVPQLTQGTTGWPVKSVQALLNNRGAGLAVDGVFGPLTDHAVRDFQTVMRGTVDGIVGPQTWSGLVTFA